MNGVYAWILLAVILLAVLIGAFFIFRRNRVRRRPYQVKRDLVKGGRASHRSEGTGDAGTVNAYWDEKTAGPAYDDARTVGGIYDGEKTTGGSYDGEKTIGNSDYVDITVDKPFDGRRIVNARESAEQDGVEAFRTDDEPRVMEPGREKDWLNTTVGAYQYQSAQHFQPAERRQTAKEPQDISAEISNTEQEVANANLERTVIPVAWRPKTILEAEIDAEGKTQTKRIYFLDDMTIGRADDCDLHLPFNYVSRKHLRITQRDGQLTIENLTADKTGGYTRLNGGPVVQGTVLMDGDVIDIADTTIRIHIVRRN